jgi:Ti-type conjugative transfer relaxase TraA
MAIQFARIKIVSRKEGGNACNSSAYNARSKIVDEKSGEVFNWTRKSDNVHHEVMLPTGVDEKFKNISILSNAVEKKEGQWNSQLLKEVVIALPDDKEFSLQDKINITHLIIEDMGWIKDGLAVQMDIHKPHDGQKNWHAHLLVQTRRFTECGKELGKKARDLNPVFKTGKGKSFIVPEEDIIHEKGKRIINDYAKKMGYETRVDAIGKLAQEHIGPVRMRSVMNEAVHRNEERIEANIAYLNSGERIIESLTRNMSVFNKNDLERVTKIIPDVDLREKLVEEVLNSKSLVSLYDENSKETGYYTTSEIRAEESKLLRLCSYIENSKNVISLGGNKSIELTDQLIKEATSTLTTEQSKALSHLLLGDSGVRILRGRAGTGKSYVLGHVQKIATSAGINVIGLAPTHKAKGELAKVGYEQNNTVKGMLFALNSGRFELAKGSLIVLDEAGMVGNDDYKELLRVAASNKCNVILSGDERQLASVQRGGMFEVFSEKYGSASILNIQRQKDAWGREVAMAFSNGNVKSGVSILQEKNRISESDTKDQSMQNLLADWSKGGEKVTDRLIIAVKNSDVDALNHGARQYLKASGDLVGEEFSVGGHHFMQGDRILIKETDKKLGLINGDFATIVSAAKDRFVVRLEGAEGKGDLGNDNQKVVEFNPSAYSGFRHGYATTVFKAQGASILNVFVFHDGFAGIRNSYVALSRNVQDLKLYINKQATKSMTHLVKQLGHDPEIGSSLSYFTGRDLADKEAAMGDKKEQGLFGSIFSSAVDFTKQKITAFGDKHFMDSDYYKYTQPAIKQAEVENVLDVVAKAVESEELGSKIVIEERAVVGGSSINVAKSVNRAAVSSPNITNTYSSKSKQTAKERFYARADRVRAKSNNSGMNSLQQKAQWEMEAEHLRSEVRFKTEMIARDILGEPNKSLSNGKTLRFGEHGKIVVRISGERMGSWYDFSSASGGDMFALVQDRHGTDFKGAAEYLRQFVGIESSSKNHLKLVHEHRSKDLTERHLKAKLEEERVVSAKAEQVEKLYSRAKAIGDRSVAYKYLTTHRGLDLKINPSATMLSDDIKTTGIYIASEKGSSEKGKYLPTIIGFARNAEGEVTGGQQIFLNKDSAAKADIAVAKKSFGKIAGSFVDVSVGSSGEAGNRITIIAEGLETGMSVSQAVREHSEKKDARSKTLCSLGISNIKNYEPCKGEKIIIAADNDGIDSNTSKVIENAKAVLEEKGAFVLIVQPSKEGDFNDVLKTDGSKAIHDSFAPAIAKQTAETLQEYLGKDALEAKLDDIDKSNLAYIQKYELSEEKIVDAYRKDDLAGKTTIEQTRKGLEMASSHYLDNKGVVEEAKQWGFKGNEIDVTKLLVGMDKREASNHINNIRNEHLSSYFVENLSQFEVKKTTLDLAELKTIITKEQEFLKNTFESSSLDKDFTGLQDEHRYAMRAGQLISENPEKLDEFFSKCKIIKDNDMIPDRILSTKMTYTANIVTLTEEANTTIERHYVRTIPEELGKIRGEAESVDEAFKAIEKEQNHLANQRGKVKYLHFEKGMLAKFERSYKQKEDNSLGDLKDISNQALQSGAKTKDELISDLQQVTDLKEAYIKLDKDVESHYIRSTLDGFKEEKQEAKTSDEVLSIIGKEQEFLSGLYGNIKYPEQHIDIVDKCELAHKQKEDNSLGDLKNISNQALQSGAKTKEELISDLQQVTDLKEAHIKLDKDVESHHISNTLDGFKEEKQEVKTSDEVLSIIGKEQEFLSGLHGNIKYPEQHIDIVDKCELAHKQKEDNSLGDLKNISNQALQSGAKTDYWLIVDLGRSTDLQAIGEKIAGDTENYQIKEAINSFETARVKAKTPIEAMKALEDKQSYLVDIDKVKYPYYVDKDILSSIETAKENAKGNKIEDLSKLVSFVSQGAICNNAEITRCLQEPDHLTKITENIMENYQAGYLKDVELRMEHIEKHGKTFLSGETFKGVGEYLAHNIKFSNEYAPMQQLNKMHEQVLAKELEVQQAEIRAQEKEQEQAQKTRDSMDFER